MGGRWSIASSGSSHALPSGDLALKASSGYNDSSQRLVGGLIRDRRLWRTCWLLRG